MRSSLDDDRLPVGEAAVEDHAIPAAPAHRRHRPEVELGIVAAQVVLGGQVHVLLATADDLPDLADVHPAVRTDERANVALGNVENERLSDLGRVNSERFGLVERRLGVRVWKQLVRRSAFVQRACDVVPGQPVPLSGRRS